MPQTPPVFRFSPQNDASRRLTDSVIAWLRGRSDVSLVIDMQDEPSFYYNGDLRVKFNNQSAAYFELKAEVSYTSSSTPYLAVEYFSDVEREVLGGPWGTTAEYYAHIYADGLLVVLLRRQLCNFLTPRLDQFQKRLIKNVRWTTQIYLIPRELLQHEVSSYREYIIPLIDVEA